MQKKTRNLLLALSMAPSAALAGGPTAISTEPEPLAPAPVAQLTQDWSGFYVGVHGSSYSGSASVIATGVEAFSFDGTMGGLHAGYDRDFGRLVVGGEVSLESGSVGYDLSSSGAPAPFSLDRVFSLKLRVGADLGRVLAYGLVGTAKATVGDSSGLPGTDPGSATGTLYGLGVSAMLFDNVAAGLEVSKLDFDPYEGAATLDSEATSVALRLSYKF